MSAMADYLSQLADLDVKDKKLISSFAVAVNFFTLQVITFQDRQSLSVRIDPGFYLTQQKPGSATEL
jgi:hypothetical protein